MAIWLCKTFLGSSAFPADLRCLIVCLLLSCRHYQFLPLQVRAEISLYIIGFSEYLQLKLPVIIVWAQEGCPNSEPVSEPVSTGAGESSFPNCGNGRRLALAHPQFFKFYESVRDRGGLVGPLGEDSLAASSMREPHRSLPNSGTLDDEGRDIQPIRNAA